MSGERVLIEGAGMTRFARQPERGLKALASEAVSAALSDAGCDLADIEAVWVANSLAGLVTGQEAVRGQTITRSLGLDYVPVFNIDNACASGASAAYLAWQAMRAGAFGRVLVVGVEQLSHPDKRRTFAALAAAADVEETQGEAGRSVFMDIYAEAARRHMDRYGVTADDYAWIAAKNHTHAVHNPNAQYRTAMTTGEVLAATAVLPPLTLPMCSPVGDGAAAVVLTTATAVRPDGRPPVTIAAAAVGSGGAASGGDPTAALIPVAHRVYEAAGIGAADIDVAEVHDAVSPAELFAYEGLGLCPPGDGVKLVREEATRLGGRIPVNPSGGLVSKGHPVAATGVAQLVELTTQLRGQAGARQVEGARVGLAHNGGGYVGGDVAAVAVTLLVGEDAR
jgi:acetyl-CoA acetyltransferase